MQGKESATRRIRTETEKSYYADLPDLMTKGLGSSPFSKGLADSKGMSLDVLRTSSRISAESEIPFLRGDWTQSNSGQIMLPSGRAWEPAGYQQKVSVRTIQYSH